ncbi:hypothetical protein ACFV28_13515 [Streptomyces sp. NPDC059720]|uniref:hypothetical protein n=1 Tax=Streptomyces sp. NPDC059720 TaxID=3346924 RepID=UPI0036978549
MMLPEGIPTVRVTGRYLFPDGRPLSGQIVWRAPNLLTFADHDVILGGPVTVPLDEQGAFTVELPATDAPGMSPSGWSYSVAEQFAGVPQNRVYQVLLPAETPAVDIADIAPTDPSTPNYVAVRGASAYEVAVAQGFVGTVDEWLASLVGPQGVQGVEGDDAYEVAVAAGYTGTREQWLASLVGPQGEQGPQGPQGEQGPQGAPGVVQSVNGQAVAEVVLDAGDVNALPDTGVVAGGSLFLDSAGGPGYRGFNFRTDGARRWVFQVDNGAESGGDAGSDFELAAWADDDTWKSVALSGKRATGQVGIGATAAELLPGARLTVNGAAGLVDLATDPAAAPGGALLYSKGGTAYVRQADGTIVPVAGGGGGGGAVDSVNGQTGVVVLDAADVGAATADHTHTAAQVGALATTARGAANGVASLDAATRVPIAQLPTAIGRNAWTPQALGFQAWSVDPAAVANPTTLKAAVVGRIYMCGINITESTQVNRVVIMARGWAGSTAVPAARFFAGIYNESGTRVAWTGSTALSNVPAAGQITGSAPGMTNNHIGAVPLPLTATATLAPGRYWAAFLLSAGSATDFYYMHIQNEAPSNPGNFFLGTAFQRHWCIASGQTTLPATVNQANGEVGLDPAIMALAMV